jgi:UDP-N-acetylmuramoyl-L-alanyl-D-glutamate--2,6-diaminopimelate ligase
VTTGKILLLVGCPQSTGASTRAAIGRIASDLADITVIANDNPGRGNPRGIAAEIAAGHAPDDGRLEIVLDRAQAIRRVIRLARAGDTVLLAGKGRATYQEEQSTIFPFDDRFHARQTLGRLGYHLQPALQS